MDTFAPQSLPDWKRAVLKVGSSLLAAGTYTLLDARYGVLPGAVLVQATTLNTTQGLPQAIANDDGSAIVSGFVDHLEASGAIPTVAASVASDPATEEAPACASRK